MESCVELFHDYLLNTKKSSGNTVDSYMRDINQFVSFCTGINLRDIKLVTGEVVGKYLDYLSKIGKSDSTRQRIIASLRSFFRFLKSGGFVSAVPTDGISVKNSEKSMPGVLDQYEIVLLLSQPDGSDFKSIRDKAMLELLYATGIKVSELIGLKTENINLQIGIIRLDSDKKERIIPIYPAAVKSIANYMVNVRPALVVETGTDILFTNLNGQQMTRQGLWKIIKAYAEKAGINKDITPHTLRHSFAAHLLENGAKLTDIKDMLGHSDISSTQIYAKMMRNKYTNAYSKYHPLAK